MSLLNVWGTFKMANFKKAKGRRSLDFGTLLLYKRLNESSYPRWQNLLKNGRFFPIFLEFDAHILP